MVALLVLTISSYGFVMMTLNSKMWLSKAYFKSKAVEVASAKMEANLAKSYSGLNTTEGIRCLGSDWERDDLTTEADCVAKQGTPYRWRALVTPMVTSKNIPYKQIQVTASYTEEGTPRAATLINYVAYPYIQVVAEDLPSALGGDIRDGGGSQASPANFYPLYSKEFNYPVTKNIQISYNLALRVINSAGIAELQTVHARSYIRDFAGVTRWAYPVTRTPILTQPLINNWVQINCVPPGKGTLVIDWCKEVGTPGRLNLKTGNVIAIAVEELTTPCVP